MRDLDPLGQARRPRGVEDEGGVVGCRAGGAREAGAVGPAGCEVATVVDRPADRQDRRAVRQRAARRADHGRVRHQDRALHPALVDQPGRVLRLQPGVDQCRDRAQTGEREQGHAMFPEVGQAGRDDVVRRDPLGREAGGDRVDLAQQFGIGQPSIGPVIDHGNAAWRALGGQTHEIICGLHRRAALPSARFLC